MPTQAPPRDIPNKEGLHAPLTRRSLLYGCRELAVPQLIWFLQVHRPSTTRPSFAAIALLSFLSSGGICTFRVVQVRLALMGLRVLDMCGVSVCVYSDVTRETRSAAHWLRCSTCTAVPTRASQARLPASTRSPMLQWACPELTRSATRHVTRDPALQCRRRRPKWLRRAPP